MNLEQAKVKLDSVSKSTATKNPKILVAELCTVVKFLLDEIDRIKSPTVSVLSRQLPDNVNLDPHHKPIEEPIFPPPLRRAPAFDPLKRQRKGDAGDAGDAT